MQKCISILLTLLIVLVFFACGQDTNEAGRLISESETGAQIFAESSVEQNIGNATENEADTGMYDSNMTSPVVLRQY